MFLRYAISKIGLVSSFFLSYFSSSFRAFTKTANALSDSLGTQKGGYKGASWYQVWLEYSCHAYRVNRLWEEAENRCVDRLTIEPQTFCGLKEIELRYSEKTNSV